MADAKHSGGLQIIFAIFLGLMVTAFIGVGVHTFHPSPDPDSNRRTRELRRQEQAAWKARAPDQQTEEDRARIQEITDELDKARDAERAASRAWGRTASILLIAFATLTMAISLVRADQLPVLSNGLLLGGVFTMVHGVGICIATDTSIARFLVMTVALVITIVLGHLRFVRRRAPSTTQSDGPVPGGEALGDLQQRISDLEQRLDGAASALGNKDMP
jgi:hypothetical protein